MGHMREDHDSPEDDPPTSSSARHDRSEILPINIRELGETDKAWALRLLNRMIANAADISACTYRSIQNDLESAMYMPSGSLNVYEKDLMAAIAIHLRTKQRLEKAA